MKEEFKTKYNPKEFEEKVYEKWLKSCCFKGELKSLKEKFSMVMPPPNITGKLHMGHALDEVLQDILIRFKKMKGFNVLWAPGVDHASIATEAKIVEQLKKEGLTKEEIGKKEFLKRAMEWKENYEENIVNQLKKLGVGCDWFKKRFTMDDEYGKAVLEFFLRLYKDGLIYRGERIINWCYCCKTSISDVEVKYEEEKGKLYYVKYYLKDEKNFILIATTRPETIFADVAVAVNPCDERFKNFVGKTVLVPIINKKIPIIKDSYVDMEFGTGAVKITPGHDVNDFEVGKRHNLKIINLFDENARLNSVAGEFEGLGLKEARKKVVLKLKELGLLLKEEEITHNVGHCHRCSKTIEPIFSMQWFVNMEKLKEPALNAVRNGEIKFVPKRFEKIYFNWMENVKDWCISRQLWWGHGIPAYYCLECGHINVKREEPQNCEKCGSSNLKKEEDTLDTWFSSALWPYAVFNWPNEEDEYYKTFYPTNVLVTGYDIIFFWVARMIFSGLYNTKKVPFKTVLIHGLVRDENGVKMSKSLGNGIDPIEVIENYGADALRFTLANGVNAGNDLRYSEKKLIAGRNFANKLWNAARFIFMQTLGEEKSFSLKIKELNVEDMWVLNELNKLIKEVTKNIEEFEISVATDKLYFFVWDVFCDWYIEIFKIRLKFKEEGEKVNFNVILYVLNCVLKLLHPFMPFITQELYFKFFGKEEIILNGNWPEAKEELNFKEEAKAFENVILIIKQLRNFRAEQNIPKKNKFNVLIETKNLEEIKRCEELILELGVCEKIEFKEKQNEEIANCKRIVLNFAVIYIFLEGLVDKEKEKEKLLKEKEYLKKEIALFEKKLSNENFLNKAPKEVVNKEKEKLELKKEKLEKINVSLGLN